ncbi:MAG: hypothetical protein BWK73_50850 [Thiothrix lacustris]|uniref:Uncharacterized protein n=1 Tax=Thiothrix lacustris TaxID=525917 RepID=A0A1Y1Q871_9GAMM|nr:MAG: hypothetical protein BWK73_50850 [Thiothrix lacustris]
MNQQHTQPQHQPTRKRARRVVQQQQPQPHKPTQKATSSGFDGLAIALLLMNAVLIAWAVLA